MRSPPLEAAAVTRSLEEGTARIGLIGSSRVGKSTISRKFSERYNGEHIEFDELIEQEDGMRTLVNQRVSDAKDLPAVERMGLALQTPFTNSDYVYDQETFVADETKVLLKIAKSLRAGVTQNTFLDLTGSAPYAQEALNAVIDEQVTVAYLEASKAHVDDIVQGYLQKPSPIVWGTLARVMFGQSMESDLEGCMRRLLEIRHTMYVDCCHVMIPWEHHRGREAEYVMDQIITRLPRSS